jgi:NAD(P)-dependent dehydrogenase (short-subunit alcohol dehydrogenase family)
MRKPSREPRLKSKVSVITGASRGLGQAIAIRFVQEGASVVLLDIADCDETMKIIAKQIGNDTEKVALAIQCDISKEDEVKQSIEKASKTFGPRIDVVVNNACAFVFKSVEDATVEDWTRSMNVNILGHGLVTKHCLPYMKHAIDKEAGFGPSIIFQGSISSFRGQPDCATYATMKGAIVQLARNCAYDLAKYNIRVNTICPGTIGM